MKQVESLKTLRAFKETPAGLIPNDWSCRPLNELAEIKYGLGQPPPLDEDGIPMIRATNIKRGKVVEKGVLRVSVNSLNTGRETFLKSGDILVVRSGAYTGDAAIITKGWEGSIAGYDLVVKPRDNLDSVFLLNYILSNVVQEKFIGSLRGRSAQPHLNAQQLGSIPVPFPPFKEQTKISAILTSADASIQKTDQIIQKTTQLKKALMQQLLSKGIGHKEFKKTEIGEVPKEWRVAKLSDLAEVVMGQSPPGDTYNSDGKGIPILNGPTEFTDYSPIPVQYTSRPTKTCRKGDILFCVRGSSTGRMNIADREYCIGRGLAAIRSNDLSNTAYVYYTLISINSKIFSAATGAGSTFPNINREELESNVVGIPPSHEQKEIALILSSIDKQLKAEEAIRIKGEAVKISLMQLLLTGKIRA